MAKLNYLKDDKYNISRYTGALMPKSIPETLERKSHLPTQRQPESNVEIPGTKKEK